MSNFSSKEMSKSVFDAINKRDLSLLESLANDDIIFDFPGVDQMKGIKRVLVFFNLLFRKYKSLQFTVIDIIAEGDKTCVQWQNSGVENDGSDYSNRGLTWFIFKDQKVSFMSDYFKNTSFIK